MAKAQFQTNLKKARPCGSTVGHWKPNEFVKIEDRNIHKRKKCSPFIEMEELYFRRWK